MPPSLNRVESGSGPAVLLIHGFPEFWYSWRKQIPALNAAGLRTIAVDLPGYNDSPKPRKVEAYRLPTVVAQIAELIEEIGAPLFVVGHDWGALASWLLAMSRPELVRKLAILNIPHPAAFVREMRQSRSQRMRMLYQLIFLPPFLPELMLPLILPRVMPRLGRFTPQEIGEYRRSWRKSGAMRGMANYYRAIRRYRAEVRQWTAAVRIPTLLIWADGEPVFQRTSSMQIEEWVPDLRVVRVPHAGHFVQTDQPEVVSEALIGFFKVDHSTPLRSS